MISPSQYLNTGNFNGLLSFPTGSPFSLLGGNLAGQTYSTFPYGGTPPFVAQQGQSSLQGLLSSINAGGQGDSDKNQIINAGQEDQPLDPGKCGLIWGTDSRCNSYFKPGMSLFSSMADFLKPGLLGLLALVLVAFGLYMLAKSTDTGQTVIKLAKTAAEA